MQNNLTEQQMDYKLDLSKLTPVPVEDRVKGHWYVVADSVEHTGIILQFHSDKCSSGRIDINKEGSTWKHWFAIPDGLPGFPKAELPDEFELKAGEWELNVDSSIFAPSYGCTYRRIKPVTIPEIKGTRADVIAALEAELSKLKGNG